MVALVILIANSANLGPPVDVTYGTHEGSYIYVSTSQQQPAGNNALVNSPTYSHSKYNNQAVSMLLHYAQYRNRNILCEGV